MSSKQSAAPVWQITTIRAKSKKRFALITDEEAIAFFIAGGKPLAAKPRSQPPAGYKFIGAYALPTNNVAEVFATKGGRRIVYLFNNLDIWLNFSHSVPPHL